jgi:hypothetical protein
MTRLRRAATAAAAATALVLAVSGCGGAAPPGTGVPQPPAVPGELTQGPDLTGAQLPEAVMPLIKGGVSRPNSELTPGAVDSTDTNYLCNMPPHSSAPELSTALQLQIYDEYGYTSQNAMRKYILDWLVPYNLGGAGVAANIWPAAVRGTGFYEKIDTGIVLRQLVCRRELSLVQAQQALEQNWYSAWLRYVVTTGHI